MPIANHGICRFRGVASILSSAPALLLLLPAAMRFLDTLASLSIYQYDYSGRFATATD